MFGFLAALAAEQRAMVGELWIVSNRLGTQDTECTYFLEIASVK